MPIDRFAALTVCSLLLFTSSLAIAQDPARDRSDYVKQTKYPVIEEMSDRNKEQREAAQKKTDEILEKITEARKEKKEKKKEFRPELSAVNPPKGPDAFEAVWHFPPTPQYLTGTCWSFSATSYLESEVKRLHGTEVKLSEMWTAYWEYVDKAVGYIESRGSSHFSQGSEANAIFRVYSKYGAVPRSAYEGELAEDGRFNHSPMFAQMMSYLEWCKKNNYWDEKTIIASVRRILDATMGTPPESFHWQETSYTPTSFLEQVVRLEEDDYVSLMSTTERPFYTRAELEVEDNWWHDASYINLPLSDWYAVLARTLAGGASITIGGDVSEPGLYGLHDIAFVPSFDIPVDYINQDARELRIHNGTTTDDHGIHVVAHITHAGHDWFLIKDSNRSSRKGRFKGYYMYRGDYLKLKMLTIGVHKDFVAEILERVK